MLGTDAAYGVGRRVGVAYVLRQTTHIRSRARSRIIRNDHNNDQLDTVKIVYFHQHFSTPQGSTGIRSYEMARALVARGHRVVMVCGSFGAGNTGLCGDFVDGVRRGMVEGIEVVEFQLAYSNRDNFVKRARTFLKFSLRSANFALREP